MTQKKKEPKRSSQKESPEEIERQLKITHTLATRLPWIAVIIILISILFILLEVYLKRGG
ncbi:MAG: hypothetical protein K940chlam7_00202 [Chlamydiae bacterium]|nr:hypothetical protein [Chlamydiota bacterium]